MIKRSLLPLCVCLVAGAASADDKWEVTASMEVVGMPYRMPPTTHTLCLAPAEQGVNEEMVPVDKNCELRSFSTSGNTSRFRVECAAPQQMTGDGEIARLGQDAYRGSLRTRSTVEGNAFDMKISYSGKRIGSCTASENTAPRP